MEGDEIEMTKDELQVWIRDRVKKSVLTSRNVKKKRSRLRAVVDRRQKLAADLLMLCDSVAACEKIVKKQYSLLGWEYKDSDSDEEDDPAGCGRVHFPSETQVHEHPTTKAAAPLLPKLEDNERDIGKQSSLPLKRELVVVLTRLPSSVVTRTLAPSTPQIHSSEDAPLRAESDMLWEPQADSGDSDSSFSSFKTGSNKRIKLSQGNTECGETHGTPSLNTDSGAQGTGAETSTPTARINIGSDSGGAETSTAQASGNTDAKNNTTLQTNADSSANSKAVHAPGHTTRILPVLQSFVENIKPLPTRTPRKQIIVTKTTYWVPRRKARATKTTHCVPQGEAGATKKTHRVPQGEAGATKTTQCVPQGEAGATKTTQCVPQGEAGATKTTQCVPQGEAGATKKTHRVPKEKITLNMTVFAQRRPMSWQMGTIFVIMTKENGDLRYKVSFKNKENCLVPGHHIAFHWIPKAAHLDVGVRVVARCETDQSVYIPGVVAELPCKKNRLRFLVFFDNSLPAYVGLPQLRLVCRPLPDPLDDILDDKHKSFLRQYIKFWPYPPRVEYKIGQRFNVECNGVQEKCEVLEVDCSLIQVVFESDQHKEWLYRGSWRLEHMATMMRMHDKKKAKASGKTPKPSKSSH